MDDGTSSKARSEKGKPPFSADRWLSGRGREGPGAKRVPGSERPHSPLPQEKVLRTFLLKTTSE